MRRFFPVFVCPRLIFRKALDIPERNGFYHIRVFVMIGIYVFKERNSENGSERYKGWKID